MTHPRVFDIIVADGFVLTELAGVVDVLRLANRVSTAPLFQWHYRSINGGAIFSSSDAIVQTAPLIPRPHADYAFVLGNAAPDCPALALGAALRNYTNRHARVVLLAEAASRYIADNGDLDTKHTTHWENRAVLLERLRLFDTKSALVVDGGSIITCAGMGATVDLTLSIASQFMSSATTMTVADILLLERIRHYNTPQPFGGRPPVSTGDTALDSCIELMQANIEFPMPISQLAIEVGLSKRSLERKFKRVMQTTPHGYYRELRLNKANNLLLNTQMRINEIGLACGFPNGFTSIYKDMFAMTPNAARKKGRQT